MGKASSQDMEKLRQLIRGSGLEGELSFIHIQVCFEVSFLEAGINEITEYYNLIPVKASLCTELNEEWLINIFGT